MYAVLPTIYLKEINLREINFCMDLFSRMQTWPYFPWTFFDGYPICIIFFIWDKKTNSKIIIIYNISNYNPSLRAKQTIEKLNYFV